MTSTRHLGREAALQILYSWEIGGSDPVTASENFFREHQPEADEATRQFAAELVYGTIGDLPNLDRIIEEHSQNWRIARLAVIDRLILRLAAWELTHQADTPPAVVLNEAVELARTFSGDDSVKFVNGVLDGIRKTIGGEGKQGTGSK